MVVIIIAIIIIVPSSAHDQSSSAQAPRAPQTPEAKKTGGPVRDANAPATFRHAAAGFVLAAYGQWTKEVEAFRWGIGRIGIERVESQPVIEPPMHGGRSGGVLVHAHLSAWGQDDADDDESSGHRASSPHESSEIEMLFISRPWAQMFLAFVSSN
nr:hypothetical protein CFP56_57575 [Quercus suber]